MPLLKTQLHDFHIYLILYHAVELAFLYNVLLCLTLKRRGTVAFHMSVGPSVRRRRSKTFTD